MHRNLNKIDGELSQNLQLANLIIQINLVDSLENKVLVQERSGKPPDNIGTIIEVLYNSVHKNKSNKVPGYILFFCKYKNKFVFAFNKT